MEKQLFTLGYSNNKILDFINILKSHSVTLLVDVRIAPRSRNRPEFNKDALGKRLRKSGIAYSYMKELGGFRRPAKGSVNMAWRNSSFRGYADYMQSKDFDRAIRKLIKLASARRTVIMCAEGNPFRCHRLLIADAMTVRGFSVFHLSGPKSMGEHAVTKFARVKGNGITYP